MAAPYSQGGGGGIAGSGSQIDSNALDKPYDLAWPWTADSVQKLDEMLRLLFLSSTQQAGNSGTVTGPTTSTTGDIATWANATGTRLADGGKLATDLVTGPASAVSGDVVQFNGTTGKIISDGSKLVSDLVTGPASATDGSIVLFNGTTGKVIKQGSASPVNVVTVTLTDAQMKTINTTPVQLLASPGAGAIHYIDQMWYNAGITTAGANNVNFTVRYATSLTTLAAAFNAVVVGSNVTRNGRPTMTETSVVAAYANNAVEVIGSNNAGATFATSNGYHITLVYYTVSGLD